ncbi:MAG TPA: asparagine synthase (glutamine-hydrolyzing) [Xanthobacteraceae bacterium]|nr:asparagine synthase (glutamine-hydrolyzing) [Xanthobacteraceae bacterium]
MCGIAGLFDMRSKPRESDPAAAARRMVDTLAHRGPDGGDAWGDPEAGVGLGHRRLAIIDLSPGGAQPMHSADGRYVISYNGEVYNFRELRAELAARGHTFRSSSDTEVMLAAFGEWGPEAAVDRFIGMFSFAVFDRQTRTLRLVRDRLGIKPLYWTLLNDVLLFGSELRALMAHPSFRKDVDPNAIASVLRYSYVPSPATVFRGVFKLPPGTILTVQPGHEPVVSTFWKLADVIARRRNDTIGRAEAVEGIDALLRDSVRRRMISDVPLGAFLSGGIDSSAVVAAMQASADRPVRTFTVGFEAAAYDEAKFAREVADRLGTEHTEVTIEPKRVLDLVADVPNWFDEPFADSSQLPTYLVSQVTRRHVTVALSGDGGDELFGGYPKYDWLTSIWRHAGRVPRPLRAALARLATKFPEPLVEKAAAALLDAGRAERAGEKARRLGLALSAATPDDAALALAAVGLAGPLPLRRATHELPLPLIPNLETSLPDLRLRMQAQDTVTYLPDDILTKVDRCSMAVALEARVPLLDHRLVEYVWSLPASLRHDDREPKHLLRQVLARYLPPSLIDRPKRGFSVPLAEWLRGPLRGWAEELLAPRRTSDDGIFDSDRIQELWKRHIAGVETNATGMWNILMVRAWAERWLH